MKVLALEKELHDIAASAFQLVKEGLICLISLLWNLIPVLKGYLKQIKDAE